MSADDRLKVIARHLGAGRNNVYPSVARHMCSSESQSSETVEGGVTLPQTGPSSDVRKPRSKQVKSVIPKNRYECLHCVCFELNSTLLWYFVIGLNDRGTEVRLQSRTRGFSLVRSIHTGCFVGTGDSSGGVKWVWMVTLTSTECRD